MTSVELKIVGAIDKYRYHLFVAVAFVVGLVMRCAGGDFVSLDMRDCLLPWFDQIKQGGGLAALGTQVGDYGLLYQTLISLMTYVEIPAIYQYKLLSALFDVALALLGAALYRDMKADGLSSALTQQIKRRSWMVAGVIWLLPTVILDSSYWGQCDSMYTFFALSAMCLLRRERIIAAFVLLGIAFGCKLQTVFFLPFIGVWYLVSKRFSALNLLITVAVMWLTGIVAFAYGRSLLDPVMIYFRQSTHYHLMYLGFPSFWMLFGDDYDRFRWLSILITLSALVVGAYVCLCNRSFLKERTNYYPLLAWFVWTMVLFLPSMHDRYAYPLDIILVMISCLDRRYIKYAIVAVFASVYFYGCFLFIQRDEEPLWLAAVYVVAYVHYSFSLYKRMTEFGQLPSNA